MSFEESLRSISLEADSDLATYTGVPGLPGSAVPNYGNQYTFVQVTGSLTVGPASAAGAAVGVVQNKPQNAGDPATVAIHGVSNVIVGTGGVSAGDEVEADANGAAVTQSAGVTLGIALADAVAGEVCPVLLQVS